MPVSPRVRMLHRHMYIDLIRAYLRERGTQAGLARSLGVTEAYLSFAMEPVRPLPARIAEAPVRRRDAAWFDVADLPLPTSAKDSGFSRHPQPNGPDRSRRTWRSPTNRATGCSLTSAWLEAGIPPHLRSSLLRPWS